VETQLARELQVSQAPVREAMLELASMGLLEERPYSGTFVRKLSVEDIEDIFDVRAFLEEYAGRRAAKQVTDAQLDEMEEVLQEMQNGMELQDFVHLDMEFHGLIMDAAGSQALKRAWTVLRMSEWTFLCAAITAESMDALIAQHWNIFRYLKKRDQDSTGAYMFLHIKNFGGELGEYFAEQNGESN
jgi:DNA-binding GntR family transcriptional regulator